MPIDPDIQEIIDPIAVVDHTPQAHRDAINAILVGLGSDTRTHPSSPDDMRIPVDILMDENIGTVVSQLRHAAIAMGIAKEPE